MSDREDLKRSIDGLSPMGVRFVARMVDSLAEPSRVQIEVLACRLLDQR